MRTFSYIVTEYGTVETEGLLMRTITQDTYTITLVPNNGHTSSSTYQGISLTSKP